MGVVIAEVEPPPSGGVAPAASLLQGFASRLDVEAGEVLDELRMSVRQPGDPVQLAAAGHRLFEVDHALQCLLIHIKGALTGFLGQLDQLLVQLPDPASGVFDGTRVGCGVFGCRINSFSLAVAANRLR